MFDTIKIYNFLSRTKFGSLFPRPPICPLPNPGLYSTFGHIVSAADPNPEYVNSDMATVAFFRSLDVMPTWASDAVRKGLMRLPKL